MNSITMKTADRLILPNVALALGIAETDDLNAFEQGAFDGFEQGFELSIGMSYDSIYRQWCYDVGTYIGSSIAVRP